MKTSNHLLVVSLFLISGLLGCIGYEEELWIEKDGTGKVEFRIVLAEMLTKMMDKNDETPLNEEKLKEQFTNIDGVRVDEAKTYEKEGKKILSVKLSFDSWKSLTDIDIDTDDKANFWGKISLKEDEDGHVIFSRIVQMNDNNTNENEEEENPFAAGLMTKMLSGFSWKYIVHFPTTVVSANAADEDVDKEANTVIWETSLLSLSEGPFTMTAKLEKPTTMNLYVIGGLAVLLLIAIVYWRQQRN